MRGPISGGKEKVVAASCQPSRLSDVSPRSAVSRPTRPVGPIPVFFAVLLLVTGSSFWHSIQELPHSTIPGTDTNAIRASLENFKLDSTTHRNKKVDSDDPTWIDRIKEDPIPNPPLSNGNETFSACLLVMDDNHRLVEWLAYHYHVLPLRYLIITVDPRSTTSPTAILNRWRRQGMVIHEWNDFNFLKPEIARNVIPDTAELQVKRDRHRIRQKNFYQACLLQCKQDNRTWVSLIDTDEFLTYNHKGGDAFEAWEKRQSRLHAKSRFADKRRIRPSQTPPTTADAGAMIQYIHQEAAAGHPFFRRSCISCPRLQFGAKESTAQERQHLVPNSSAMIDPDRLDTLRFRKHAERQDFVKNGLSKSILDVSRIDTFPRIQSLHRPIKTLCTAPWKDDWDSGLRINHYLGSWEAYSFRDDSRRGGERSFEGWAFKAQDAEETDDNIRPWIGGFVQQHGPDQAAQLLQGAGLPRGYQHPTDKATKNWTIMFLDEILSVNQTKGNDNRVAFDNFVRDFHFVKNQSTEGLL